MINKFLDYIAIEKRYSQQTVEAYRNDLYRFCTFLGVQPEEYDPLNVDDSDVKNWVLDMMEREHYSPRSVKQNLSALKSFYKFLLRIGVVNKDVTRMVEAPKADKPLPVFFKPSEMERATALIYQGDDFESIRDNLIISMLYQTGMRQAEMLGLKDGDIDSVTGQIRIFGKRSKERIVPIGDGLIEQISTYLSAREDLGNLPGTFFVRLDRHKRAVPLTKTALYTIVRTRMGEVSTLKKHSPHVLRHTFATTMLNNGADIRVIKELLGHVSLDATQVYTHATFEQIKQIYKDAHPRANGRARSK